MLAPRTRLLWNAGEEGIDERLGAIGRAFLTKTAQERTALWLNPVFIALYQLKEFCPIRNHQCRLA